ncbi:MAG: hypothetical protein ACREPS_07835 [Rhodanobacteraceae bacterium]
MGNVVRVSRLQFAGAPAERFALFHSRKAMLWAALALLAALIVAAVLQAEMHNPTVWLLLFTPLLINAGVTLLWAEPARFSLRGDVAAIFEYLDQLMRAAPDYQRSAGAGAEVRYQRNGKRWLAESRSYCVLAVQGDAVEVWGSRDILRRLRYWGARHFAQA